MTESDPTALVRAAVARTRREGTAALRYREHVVWLRQSLAQWLEDPSGEHQHSFLRRLDAWRAKTLDGLHTLDGPVGQIDLDGDRSMYSVGQGWTLCVDGRSYIGEPGEWELDEETDALTPQEPQWLLAVLEGCSRAEDRGLIKLGTTQWHHYRAGCDLSHATSGTGRQVRPPCFVEDLDLTDLLIDVWLDLDGRVQRAVFHERPERTILELSNFGAAPCVVPPLFSEILHPEDC
jgi:hypothetical protein